MALAFGVATFTGTDTANFTWTPITGALTSNPPKVLGMGVTVTDGTTDGAYVAGNPTNVGGTVNSFGSFTGFVVLLGMD